jgi:DNA-binding transcriptional ArsR family regulator
MKRDMDLVRRLLVLLEAKPGDTVDEITKVDGYDPTSVKYHLILLFEAGLITGEPTRYGSSGRILNVIPSRLTWEGHEILAAARDESIWNKVKSKLASSGADVPLALLKDLLIQGIRGQFGSPGGAI